MSSIYARGSRLWMRVKIDGAWESKPTPFYPMPYVRTGELGEELVAFQSWCLQRKDEFIPWETWWGKAGGNVRKLGTRRASLPLFPDEVER